eukprot:9530825-Lingulodinium_polyedra.AAC.1
MAITAGRTTNNKNKQPQACRPPACRSRSRGAVRLPVWQHGGGQGCCGGQARGRAGCREARAPAEG